MSSSSSSFTNSRRPRRPPVRYSRGYKPANAREEYALRQHARDVVNAPRTTTALERDSTRLVQCGADIVYPEVKHLAREALIVGKEADEERALIACLLEMVERSERKRSEPVRDWHVRYSRGNPAHRGQSSESGEISGRVKRPRDSDRVD